MLRLGKIKKTEVSHWESQWPSLRELLCMLGWNSGYDELEMSRSGGREWR